jgi:putative membrane protein
VGRPATVIAWGLRPTERHALTDAWRRSPLGRVRRGSAGVMIAAVAFHVGAWWVWHLPPAFDLALRNDLVHVGEHATLFASGLVLWWVVVGIRWRDRTGMAVLALFAAEVGTGMLAALMVLADHPLYTVSPELVTWAVHPMADQQLGGVIMWVPGGFVYLGAVTVLVARWLARGPAPATPPAAPPPPPPPLRSEADRGTTATPARR